MLEIGDKIIILRKLHYVHEFINDGADVLLRTWSKKRQGWYYRVEITQVVLACLEDGTFRRAK